MEKKFNWLKRGIAGLAKESVFKQNENRVGGGEG